MRDLTTLYKEIKQVQDRIAEINAGAKHTFEEYEKLFEELDALEMEIDEVTSLEKASK